MPTLCGLTQFSGVRCCRFQQLYRKSKRASVLAACFQSRHKQVAVAVELAIQCGAAMRECDGCRSAAEWKDDHGIDPVTKTDQDNETLVAKGLAAAFPDHLLIGEEAAAAAQSIPALSCDAPTWIVDPIGEPHYYSCNKHWTILECCLCMRACFTTSASFRWHSELYPRGASFGGQYRPL